MMTGFRQQLAAAAVLLLAMPLQATAEDWPQFRGPTGQGLSTEKNLPLQWSGSENVAWKVRVPGEGWSSPIVVGDLVFVTSTTNEGQSCHVICFDRKSGDLRWNTKVFDQEVRKKRAENSDATPTPVSDGKRVYAVFSGGGIAALDFSGKLAWTHRDIAFYGHHGLAASPIIYKDLLLMAYDGSSDGEDNKIGWKIPWKEAVLLAVDTKTGKERWRGKRGLSRLGHVTPNILHEDSGDQIISGAGDAVQGFDPASGELIWSIYSQGEGVTPSVVVGDGLVFSCSGFEAPTIRVIRTGGQGDVTKTHIAWEQTRGVPSLASPLYVAPYLYAVTDAGIATCLDAASGEIVWQERIEGKHSSSPVYADGRIYFLSEAEGETVVLEAGPKFNILARNRIDEKCKASIAISQGNLFLRSEEHLFCIGPAPK
ncbi:outer membrane biogenesis protein BamB [Lignipirellula cremea]|uniref:Outer membrane biogenesis protein BamB n=2 Tax=Lignipirellula cremea TaxID=2528010 RepID=A0A518DR16_9BACT|nr:outer membrane biogenesis protein BamB [Lignipirellula cremea]